MGFFPGTHSSTEVTDYINQIVNKKNGLPSDDEFDEFVSIIEEGNKQMHQREAARALRKKLKYGFANQHLRCLRLIDRLIKEDVRLETLLNDVKLLNKISAIAKNKAKTSQLLSYDSNVVSTTIHYIETWKKFIEKNGLQDVPAYRKVYAMSKDFIIGDRIEAIPRKSTFIHPNRNSDSSSYSSDGDDDNDYYDRNNNIRRPISRSESMRNERNYNNIKHPLNRSESDRFPDNHDRSRSMRYDDYSTTNQHYLTRPDSGMFDDNKNDYMNRGDCNNNNTGNYNNNNRNYNNNNNSNINTNNNNNNHNNSYLPGVDMNLTNQKIRDT